MPSKEININELAKKLGVDIGLIREKQKLIQTIIKIRKSKKMSQSALAKKVGVTQGRIAQIESGMNTSNVTFDVLFSILHKLGIDYRIIPQKAA